MLLHLHTQRIQALSVYICQELPQFAFRCIIVFHLAFNVRKQYKNLSFLKQLLYKFDDAYSLGVLAQADALQTQYYFMDKYIRRIQGTVCFSFFIRRQSKMLCCHMYYREISWPKVLNFYFLSGSRHIVENATHFLVHSF